MHVAMSTTETPPAPPGRETLLLCERTKNKYTGFVRRRRSSKKSIEFCRSPSSRIGRSRAEICPVGSIAPLSQLRRGSRRLVFTQRRRHAARELSASKLCSDTGKSLMQSAFGEGPCASPAVPAAYGTRTLDGTGFLRKF